MDRSTVIERLRASKRFSDEKELTNGEKAGRQWAERDAEVLGLQRMEEAQVQEWEFSDVSSAFSIAQRLFFVIEPDWNGNRGAASEFWEKITGDEEMPAAEYVEEFAKGAMDLWDEVKDQL